MAVFPFQYVNRRGIPVLKTTGVTVETTGGCVFLSQPRICKFVVPGTRAG